MGSHMVRNPISLYALAGVLIATSAQAQTKEPSLYFYPSKTWNVSQTQDDVPCSVQSEFNNGFTLAFEGSNKWIEALKVDFRQDIFQPDQPYQVTLNVPGKITKTLPAQATGTGSLTISMEGQKEIYQAARDASVIDVGVEDNNFRFYLVNITPAARDFEKCMAGGTLQPAEQQAPVSADAQPAANPMMNEAIAMEEKETNRSGITEIVPPVPVAEIREVDQSAQAAPVTPVNAENQQAKIDKALALPPAESRRKLSEQLAAQIEENPAIADPDVAMEDMGAVTAEPLEIQQGELAPPPPFIQEKTALADESKKLKMPPENAALPKPQNSAPAEPIMLLEEKKPTPEPVKEAAAPLPAQDEAPAAEMMAEALIEAPAVPPAEKIPEPILHIQPEPIAVAPATVTSAPVAMKIGKTKIITSPDAPIHADTMAGADITHVGKPEPKSLAPDYPQVPAPAADAPAAIAPAAQEEPPVITWNAPPAVIPPAMEEAIVLAPSPMTPPQEAAPIMPEPRETSAMAAPAYIPPPQAAPMAIAAPQPEPIVEYRRDPDMARKVSELEAALNKLKMENEALNHELKSNVAATIDERKSIASENWDLERATMRYNEAERQIKKLGEQIQIERAQCNVDKKDIEGQLFDPQITDQKQMARLADLEQQLIQAQQQLDDQRMRYEARLKAMQGGSGTAQ